jgi:hypothetical protein
VGDIQAWRDALTAHHASQRRARGRKPGPAITGIRLPPREEVTHMSSETEGFEPEPAAEDEQPEAAAPAEDDAEAAEEAPAAE